MKVLSKLSFSYLYHLRFHRNDLSRSEIKPQILCWQCIEIMHYKNDRIEWALLLLCELLRRREKKTIHSNRKWRALLFCLKYALFLTIMNWNSDISECTMNKKNHVYARMWMFVSLTLNACFAHVPENGLRFYNENIFLKLFG